MTKPKQLAKTWFAVLLNAAATVADIDIYDYIGYYGVRAKDFIQQVRDLPESIARINLNVNSPGGSITEGNAIYNALLRLAEDRPNLEIIANVDFAASMASVIIMGADRINIAENAAVMIHNPWTAVAGDAEELRKNADLLDKMKNNIIRAYQRHSNKTPEELTALMDAETWLFGQEAVDAGFAHNVTEISVDAAAAIAVHDLHPLGSAKLEEISDKYLNKIEEAIDAAQNTPDPETHQTDPENQPGQIPGQTAAAEGQGEVGAGLVGAGLASDDDETAVATDADDTAGAGLVSADPETPPTTGPVAQALANLQAIHDARVAELNNQITALTTERDQFRDQIGERDAIITELNTQILSLAPGFGAPTDDDQPPPPKASHKDHPFMKAVQDYKAENACDFNTALAHITDTQKELHAQYVADVNK